MKMFFASLFSGVIWYGLLSVAAMVALLCASVLMILLLAGSIVAGGPVLLCWCAIRFFQRKKDVRALSVSALPVRPAE